MILCKEIFPDNNVIGFVSSSCSAASNVKVNTIMDDIVCKTILDFVMLYNQKITEYASVEIKYNRLCQ